MLSHFLTYLKPSSSENLILAFSDLTFLDMGLSETSMYYMSHVRGIYQHMEGVTMEKITPLLAIASLYHDRYPGVKI